MDELSRNLVDLFSYTKALHRLKKNLSSIASTRLPNKVARSWKSTELMTTRSIFVFIDKIVSNAGGSQKQKRITQAWNFSPVVHRLTELNWARYDNAALRKTHNTSSPRLLRLDAASAWPPLGTCVHERRIIFSRRKNTPLSSVRQTLSHTHIHTRVSLRSRISTRRAAICNDKVDDECQNILANGTR